MSPGILFLMYLIVNLVILSISIYYSEKLYNILGENIFAVFLDASNYDKMNSINVMSLYCANDDTFKNHSFIGELNIQEATNFIEEFHIPHRIYITFLVNVGALVITLGQFITIVIRSIIFKDATIDYEKISRNYVIIALLEIGININIQSTYGDRNTISNLLVLSNMTYYDNCLTIDMIYERPWTSHSIKMHVSVEILNNFMSVGYYVKLLFIFSFYPFLGFFISLAVIAASYYKCNFFSKTPVARAPDNINFESITTTDEEYVVHINENPEELIQI